MATARQVRRSRHSGMLRLNETARKSEGLSVGPPDRCRSRMLSFIMLRHTVSLEALNLADERATVHRRTWHEALDVMLALWEEARALNPQLGDDWREDIKAD